MILNLGTQNETSNFRNFFCEHKLIAANVPCTTCREINGSKRQQTSNSRVAVAKYFRLRGFTRKRECLESRGSVGRVVVIVLWRCRSHVLCRGFCADPVQFQE